MHEHLLAFMCTFLKVYRDYLLPTPPVRSVFAGRSGFLCETWTIRNMPVYNEFAAFLVFCPVRSQERPKVADRHALHRQHAVLHTIQILPMNRWYKLAGDEAEKDAWREVVLAQAVAELSVLCEDLGERQWYGL